MAKINKIVLRSVAQKVMASPRVHKAAKQAAIEAAEKGLKAVIKAAKLDLDTHPITVEIKSGASSGNSSGTLSTGTGRRGNLYSFLGFSSEANANFEKMKSIWDMAYIDKRGVKKGKTGRNGVWYSVKTNLPVKTAFYDATPNHQWAGSWVKGVEKGFDNVMYYKYKAKGISGSKSGKAIQTKSVYNAGGSFNRQEYIIEIRQKAYERLRGKLSMPSGMRNIKAIVKAKAIQVFGRFIRR